MTLLIKRNNTYDRQVRQQIDGLAIGYLCTDKKLTRRANGRLDSGSKKRRFQTYFDTATIPHQIRKRITGIRLNLNQKEFTANMTSDIYSCNTEVFPLACFQSWNLLTSGTYLNEMPWFNAVPLWHEIKINNAHLHIQQHETWFTAGTKDNVDVNPQRNSFDNYHLGGGTELRIEYQPNEGFYNDMQMSGG